MLKFPPNWQTFTWGAIAKSLFGTIKNQAKLEVFGECLTWATIDLTAVQCFGFDGFEKKVLITSSSTWQINDTIFAYQPLLTDDTIKICSELMKQKHALVLLVPPGQPGVWRTVCESIFRHRTPTIWSLDTFLCYRMTITPFVLGRPRDYVLYELVMMYNRHMATTRYSRSLQIEAPLDLEKAYRHQI
jgi:hypothetical protein